MINELTVLDALKETIQSQLNEFLDTSGEDGQEIPSIDNKNVEINFPDIDNMPKKNMFYIQPNYANYENLSTMSDASSFSISVFIICKKDKQENLTKKIYHYFNAFYELMRANMDLNGVVDFVDITDSDFYPAVEGNLNVQAVEVSVSVRYTKDW